MSQPVQGSIEIILCDRRFCRAVCQRPTGPFEQPFWCADCTRKFVRSVPKPNREAEPRQVYVHEIAVAPAEPEDFE